MIKTINTVLLDPMNGHSDNVYFDISRFLVDKTAPFKGEVGMVSFEVRIFIMVDGKLVQPTKRAKMAQYKLSTFLSRYGTRDFTSFLDDMDNLAISEIGLYSNQYWGLTAEDLEIYPPVENV